MTVKPEEIVTDGFTLSEEQRIWLANQVNTLAAKGEGSVRYGEDPIPPTAFEGVDPEGNPVTIHDVDGTAMHIVDEACELEEEAEEASDFEEEDPLQHTIQELGAEPEVSYENYDVDDMDRYLESIGTLGFIELASLKKQAEQTLAQINDAKEVMGAIDASEKIQDPTMKDIMKNDFFQGYDLMKSKQEFEEQYPKMESSMTKVLEAVNARLEKDFPNTNSTKFLSEEMVSLLTKKKNKLMKELEVDTSSFSQEELAAFQSKYISSDLTLQKLDLEIEAFSHRLDAPQALYDEAVRFLTNVKPIKKAYDRIRSLGDNPKVVKLVPTLRKIYSEKQLDAVYEFMEKEVFENLTAAKLFMIFLDVALERDRKNYLSAVVKTFILNICDIRTDVFDLRVQDHHVPTLSNLTNVEAYTKLLSDLYRALFLEYANEL